MNRKSQDILNKTVAFLLDQGTTDVGMDGIAAFSDASKMTVYKYFSDKKHLLSAAGEAVLSENLAALSSVVCSEKNLIARMYDFIAVVTEFVDSGRFDICDSLRAKLPELRSVYGAYVEESNKLLRQLIAEGFLGKCFKPGLEKDLIFDYIHMGIQYYQQNEHYRVRMKSDDEFQNQMMRFMIGNIFMDSETVEGKSGER